LSAPLSLSGGLPKLPSFPTRRSSDLSKVILAEFREAVRLRPDFADAHNNMGLVLAQGNEDQAAIAEFREALRIRPDFADAQANRSEEHTSELQSPYDLVCRLLLEKND